jgi:hypothetical protein
LIDSERSTREGDTAITLRLILIGLAAELAVTGTKHIKDNELN